MEVKTYIRFSQHGETHRYLVPVGLSLADGLTKVFASAFRKTAGFLINADQQISEMNDAISQIPSDDPDKHSVEAQAKETATQLIENCYVKIVSIEVEKGNKTTYL